MHHAVTKVDSGNAKAWVTERGTTFGYQDLVVDGASPPCGPLRRPSWT